MYSFKTTPQGGTFKSATTRREYPFISDPAGKGKKAAMQLMRADDRQFRQAAEARPKSPPPTREQTIIHTGHAEKAEKVQHLVSSPRWAEETPGDRLAQLERAKAGAKNDGELAKINRRIAAHQTSQVKGEFKAAVRQARQDARTSPEYLAAVADADAALDALSMRSDIDDSYVQGAKRMRLQLLHSADIDQFRRAEQALQSRYDLEASAKIASAELTMANMRHDIKGVKADSLLPAETGGSDATE